MMRLMQRKDLANILLLLLYSSLLGVMLLGPTDSAPGGAVRLAFVVIFFLPLFIFRKSYVPAVLFCFLTVMYNSPVYCPLPYTITIYIAILFIGLFLCFKKHSIPIVFILLLSLMCIVDLVTTWKLSPVEQVMIIMLLLVFYMDFKDKDSIALFMNSFCIVSLTLSIFYFLNFQDYLVTFAGEESGMERSGWIDPNYFSSVIGMGVLVAIYLLLNNNENGLLHKCFLIVTIGISFAAQITLASRGALLAILVTVSFLMIKMKIKTKYKVLFLLAAVGGIYFLYVNNYFELLLFRLTDEGDINGGNGRTAIWQRKLDGYSNFNPIEMLFGIGLEPGLKLGYNEPRGFHNDFVGFLCSYGLVGLGLFLYTLYFPVHRSSKSERRIVTIFILYLLIVCFSLEPFLNGLIAYFAFYMLIVAMAEHSRLRQVK